MAEREGEGLLFSDCRIAFVPSTTLMPKTIADISRIVEKYGGEILEPEPNGRIAVHHATHIVSNTIDFEDYGKAQAMMVPVLVSDWVTNSLHRRKLAPLRPHNPDPRMIFHNVNVTCADIPDSDKEAIIGATLALGGSESKDLNKLTTHVCALTMDHQKCATVLARNLKCKIVLPHWFDDCFKLGKRIDEGPYLLPDPEFLKRDAEGGEVAIPPTEHMQGASSAVPNTVPNVRARELSVFDRKKVMLSDQLPTRERFIAVVRDLVVKGGGRLTNDVDECDMFICQYRDGEDYIRAAQTGKDVGNLSWLLYLIAHDQWTSPLRRLLHYPVPRYGIPGFEGKKITISNYGGEARHYLENLIWACGGEYTKTMKQDNTHLITARNNSEKCEAALDWGVSMVNHLWIEESYAKCEIQNIPNNTMYTHFPSHTNLSEVIGQTFLHEPTLHTIYYPGGDDDADSVARRNRKIQEAADENVYAVLEPPSPGREGTSVPDSGEVTGRNGRSSSPEEPATKPAAKKGRKRKSEDVPPLGKASSNKPVFTTPARASRHTGTGKENDTPSSERLPSSRSAKDKAKNRLSFLGPDIALYEKEKKRMARDGHGPWGGKRAAAEVERQRIAAAAAEAAEKEKNQENDEDDEDEVAERPAKRQRQSLPAVQYRITLTSFTRWSGQKGKETEETDRRKLRRMGIQVVQEGQPCDYLAAPRVIRTQKFVVALSRGPEVIDSQFVLDALETGKLPDLDEYRLQDADHPDLSKYVARARQNKGRLLSGVGVYCTAEIGHGAAAFKAISEANGATFKLYRARSGVTIRPTTAEEDGGLPPDPVYLITGESSAEKLLWPKFAEMARQGHMEPRIVESNWLLDVAITQQLKWDDKYLAGKDGEKKK